MSNKKTVLILTIGGGTLLILFFVFIVLSNALRIAQPGSEQALNATPTLSPSATPTPIPQETLEEYSFGQASDEAYIDAQLSVAPIEASQVQETSKTGALLDVLPYEGENFMFSYNYEQLSFVLALDRENAEAGQAEFEAFLRGFAIEDQSELPSLDTELY